MAMRNEGHQVDKAKNLGGYSNTIHFRLNLTVANRVYIIEPQWNPTVESQATGRVMRIGQQKQVHVTRYIVKNSIEEVRVASIPFPDSPSRFVVLEI
jgi:hypothetical protein